MKNEKAHWVCQWADTRFRVEIGFQPPSRIIQNVFLTCATPVGFWVRRGSLMVAGVVCQKLGQSPVQEIYGYVRGYSASDLRYLPLSSEEIGDIHHDKRQTVIGQILHVVHG